MIGKTISHYKILEKLGEGGMGVVYKAEDTKLKRTVALKFLAPELARDPEARRRFLHEAQAASALDHPSICTVYEADEHGGNAFIAMTCLEGQSLKEKLASGPLKLDEAIDLAIQIAEGLREAHEKGVVHRDIKPANLMITHKGRATMMDFGLAKVLGRTKLTRTGMTIGTAAYMSPEQARGEKTDHRSDIWSLGVVLYEMISGRVPFGADYEQALVYSILNEPPEPLTGLRTGVPMDLESIVSRCMEKNPEERYQSAGDLIADLRRMRRRRADPAATDLTRTPSGRAARSTRPVFLAMGIVVLAVVAWAAYRHFVTPGVEPSDVRKMLVVLPFENLGAPEDEYFAQGITEEITSHLASVERLGVISRTSAVQYANTDKSIRQIGDELGVEYVLEGTIRWARDSGGVDRVRIAPQLIRVDDDTHLWAGSYDRVIEDIFAVQSELAQKVVEQLGITLLEVERPAVGIQPTDNLQAYHAYLRGNYYAGMPHFTLENWNRVIENYQQAVEIDPNFSVAYAELSKAHARLFYFRHDLSEERKNLARTATYKAVELAPDSPETNLAVGYYYFWVEKDSKRALENFDLAARGRPESAEIHDAKAELFRHRGRWQEAVDHYRRACELSPRNPDHFVELAITKWWLRSYPEAMALSDEAIALAPDQTWPYLAKAFNYWSWNGALKEARSELEKIPEGDTWSSYAWYWQRMNEGEYREAIEGLQSIPEEWIRLKIGTWPKSLLAAYAHEQLGESQVARANYEEAKSELEKAVLSTLTDPRYHSSLGIACAALGQRELAIQEGNRAVELYPISVDAAYGLPYAIDLAHIYTILGEYDAALVELDHLLSIPGWISVAWIRIDPRWIPLREHPGYRVLMDKYSRINL